MMTKLLLKIIIALQALVASSAKHYSTLTNDGDNSTANTTTEFSSSRVMVHIPSLLASPDGMEHIRADFGFGSSSTPQGSISAFVYFVDGPLCDPFSLYFTNSSNVPKIYPSPKSNDDGSISFQSPFILLTRSDHCSPVSKVRNAQALGAAAVVIGHDHCRCSDIACTKKFSGTCINTTVALASDGSSGDITIPSFMLYHVPAEAVMDMLKNKKQSVLMELTWGLQPAAESNDTVASPVVFRLWTSAHDPILDHYTLHDLKAVHKAFTTEQVLFKPHYAIMDGSRFDCQKSEENGPCDHSCTNHGRYCSIHAREVSGFEILQETVRRICIWNHYADPTGVDVGNPEIYWDYVIFHRTQCSGPNSFANASCITHAFEAANMPVDHDGTYKKLDDCMNNESGDLHADIDNPFLEHHMKTQLEFGIVQLPTLTVEKYQLENVGARNLFLSICQHYWSMKVTPKNFPDVCDNCGECPNLIGCLEQGHCVAMTPRNSSHESNEPSHGDQNHKGHKKRRHGWFWTFFILLLLGGGACYYYVRYSGLYPNRTGNDRSGLLNNYFQLGGEE
jgi:hypothetical protein